MRHIKPFAITAMLAAIALTQPAAQTTATSPSPAAYNVSWNVSGPGPAESMPLGNGDIGLNVWAEADGSLSFYISKTDALGGEVNNPYWDGWMKQGGALMKLGLVHVSLNPSPYTGSEPFKQTLMLQNGQIQMEEGSPAAKATLRVWVDANNPVIHLEVKSAKPTTVTVNVDDWRLHQGDTTFEDDDNRITWYHRNTDTADPHLTRLTFGAIIQGAGMVRNNAMALQTAAKVTTQGVAIYPLTITSNTSAEWINLAQQQAETMGKINPAQAWAAHQKWWDQFWHRSWIYLHGDSTATQVTQGYVLQRFKTACAGRGAHPIKFNGSIFNVDNPHHNPPMDADNRAWGGQYWFQNTRAMYWPRLQAGDFDEMLPLFNMYRNILPANTVQVANYYHHGGAYFAETAPFWGGLLYMGPEVKGIYTGHYFTPILELSMMMLDYYDYTGDTAFARQTLLPVATAGLQFFNEHFKRDSAGKLLLDPDNSIETFWKVHDPAPDIAALQAVLPRMIALPGTLVDEPTRSLWKNLLAQLPPLPTGMQDGLPVLLPYTGPQTTQKTNSENPELYAVYPFRLYGLTKPGLQLALNTFNTRRERSKGCWVQDPIQAAMLGLTDVAREYVTFNFNRKDPSLKFPAFWAAGNDYMPDEDNGGNGENGLQQMLMQADGKKILLLPAWPSDWDADFKLHAPFNTTVQGKIIHGKLISLVVTPASRKADVVDMTAGGK